MENHYVQLLLHFLQTHPILCHLFIFIIAFSESLPLIGTIVPGSVTMTLVGILIGNGTLPAFSSLSIATAGAFVGDATGFAFGYYYNEKIRTFWPFRKYPKWLVMGEDFFKKHGGKSIILGRFIGPARSTVPLIAGILRLSWLRFSAAAIPSAALWALLYMTPGILLGALSREIPRGETTQFFLYGVGALLLLWLIYWLIQHFFIQLARGINTITDRCWRYLMHHHAGRYFIRLITNQQKPSDHHQLTLSLAAIISAVLFLLLFLKVQHYGVLPVINFPVFHLLQNIRTPRWDTIFITITLIGMPKTIMLISVFITAGFALKKQWRTAIHFFAGLIIAVGATEIFKKLSHSPRPRGFEFVATSSSFPSGHTTLSFVVFGLLAFFIAQIISKNTRWIVYTAASLLILSVAFSRVYLGAHWVSDIVGSFLLGFSIVLCCIVAYRRMPNKKSALQLTLLSAVTIISLGLFIPWSVMIKTEFSNNKLRYTRVWHPEKISLQAWWQSPLHHVPLYRNNRLGLPFQPFNVQWQGQLQKIKKQLLKKGWVLMTNHTKLKSKLQRFTSFDAQYHIPILSWLYQDKPPVLFFIKKIAGRKRRSEERLWKSNIHLQPNDKPLLLGATNIRIAHAVLLSLKSKSKISLADKGGLNILYHDTPYFQRKIIHAHNQVKSDEIKRLEWDGDILLLKE